MKVVLITIMVLGFSACTGATEPTTAPVVPANPRAGIIQQIDQLCLDMYKRQQSILWPDDFEGVQRYYEKTADSLRAFIDKVQKIEVPEEGEESLNEMLDEARTVIRLLEQASGSVSIADLIEEEDEFTKQMEKVNHRFNVAAFRYGLVACADPKPARVY